jgi:1,4-alpha-glucan branching enzyme
MGPKKRYLKTKNLSKVTFQLPSEAAPEAKRVALVGDFNDWNPAATPMTRLKSGEFKATVDLEPGRDYEYRFLIEDKVWENDWNAEGYKPSGIPGAENSVVHV